MQKCSSQLDWLQRLGIATAISWSVLGIYMFIANHPRVEPVPVHMPNWVPFLPQATPAYFAILFVTWLLPVAIRDTRNFLNCQIATLLAYVFAICWWVHFPTRLNRPALHEATWIQMYEFLVALDPPTNITPCAHGIGPLVACWYFGYQHPTWRWPLLTVALLSLASIPVTYQHRPIDVMFGTAAAAVAVALVDWGDFRERKNTRALIA